LDAALTLESYRAERSNFPSGEFNMDPRVLPLASQLRLNASMVRRALGGLEVETAARRPVANVNSLAFVAVHVVDARAYLLGILGADASHDWSEVFAAAQRFEDIDSMPTPEQLLETFDILSARLEARLVSFDAESLNQPSGESFPTGDESILGAISFLAFHESYHVGQIALLHRAVGRGSLSGV
jgi:uncharacterized damage-inducible protein DinB